MSMPDFFSFWMTDAIVLGDLLVTPRGARLEPKSKQGDLVLRSRRAWERSRVKNLKTKGKNLTNLY